MAAQNLTTVPLSDFPQVLAEVIDRTLALVLRAEAHVHLTTCFYESAYGECRERATVHHLASEQEFCLRHFGKVSRG